ncbi:MAG TPA: hypothetical protein VJ949_05230, partial [Cryomorphaceae bacterium]|nr:hypothetical protein [Cryomorphaceae bacterium]
MLTNRKYTLLAVFVTCSMFFGMATQSSAQCDPGETAYEITLAPGGSFVGERSWEIVPTLGGDPVISQECGDYEGGTYSFCLTPGVSYTFIAYDDFGDGWNFFGVDPVWSIGIAGGPIVTEGGNPNGCSSGDFTTDCIGQCEEYSESFIASDPPDCTSPGFSLETERSCDDFNFSATVTIDAISPGASLLLITADAGGVQLAGATVPNLVGQTATLADLPLDDEVIISVNVLGATCPSTETVNISSIGCPVPLTCGEPLEVEYCYDNNDESL